MRRRRGIGVQAIRGRLCVSRKKQKGKVEDGDEYGNGESFPRSFFFGALEGWRAHKCIIKLAFFFLVCLFVWTCKPN